MRLPRIPAPMPVQGLLLLAALYLMLGLFGHSPWKAEDAIGIGIVHQMLADGPGATWLLPHLAGEPYVDDGPLYYVLAALCAKLLGVILPGHDGARLASALCLAATLWLVRAAVRDWFRRNEPGAEPAAQEGDAALLVLLGTLGLFVHAHETLAENAALAGAALAWYGLARFHYRPLPAGLWLGLGLAIALWSKGPAAMLPPLAAALVLPGFDRYARRRAYLRFLVVGLVVVLLAALAWYALLRHHGTVVAGAWWQRHGVPADWSLQRGVRQLQLLSWAVWPAWPLAAWALYDRRHRLREDPILPLFAGVLAGVAVFMFSREINEVFAMPLMLPLAMAAGVAVPVLRRGAAHALAWFGAMTFTVLGGLVWLGWVAMMTGVPERLARNFARLEPGFVARFDPATLAFAAAITLLWLWLITGSVRSPQRGAAYWAGGIALLWGLAMTLWLPWIDYGKTYAPVARSLSDALARVRTDCVESRGLGEAQRAVFHYYAGLVTRRQERHGPGQCSLLLVQADSRQPAAEPEGWRRIWEGNRPRDRERFRLYIRH